jgi:hypothetical protein
VGETDGGSIQSDCCHVTPGGKTVFEDPGSFESFTVTGEAPGYHHVRWKYGVESTDELTPIHSQPI